MSIDKVNVFTNPSEEAKVNDNKTSEVNINHNTSFEENVEEYDDNYIPELKDKLSFRETIGLYVDEDRGFKMDVNSTEKDTTVKEDLIVIVSMFILTIITVSIDYSFKNLILNIILKIILLGTFIYFAYKISGKK